MRQKNPPNKKKKKKTSLVCIETGFKNQVEQHPTTNRKRGGKKKEKR
jgi:hypothetical protein